MGSHCCKCCLNTSQAKSDWSCPVAAAALHNLILSLLPLIQLTGRIKLERIFFSEVMSFFPIQTQLCAWVLAMLQSQTKTSQSFSQVSWCSLGCTNWRTFVSSVLFGFFFFSSTSTSVQSSCASSKCSQQAEEGNVLTELKGWNWLPFLDKNWSPWCKCTGFPNSSWAGPLTAECAWIVGCEWWAWSYISKDNRSRSSLASKAAMW